MVHVAQSLNTRLSHFTSYVAFLYTPTKGKSLAVFLKILFLLTAAFSAALQKFVPSSSRMTCPSPHPCPSTAPALCSGHSRPALELALREQTGRNTKQTKPASSSVPRDIQCSSCPTCGHSAPRCPGSQVRAPFMLLIIYADDQTYVYLARHNEALEQRKGRG